MEDSFKNSNKPLILIENMNSEQKNNNNLLTTLFFIREGALQETDKAK